MTWKVEFNDEFGFIETVYTGKLTKQNKQDSTAQALALARGDGPHLFLADIQDAELELSLFDLYDIPGEWDVAGATRRNKLAVVAREGGRLWQDLKFFETVCRNRGWKVGIFSGRQDAIGWLKGK
ncbi:MAG: hypothetical protein ACYSWO_06300 [Planctomycetota bacterium]|jgi:hypothetical protein